MDSRDSKFFVLQSERLSALLDVIVTEANAATDPEACIDYLELTEILVDLLDKAQLYGILPPNDIQARQHEVNKFIDQIHTVQAAVGDWDSRTKSKVPSKKRPRSADIDMEITAALKRPKASEMEQDVVANATFNLQHGDIMPSIEKTSAPWWTEPFYD